MNSRQPTHMTYNQQTNNQYNDRRSMHASRTKMVFNGPIHGYIEHVTAEGPVVAYSEVTYVDRGYIKPSLFRRTTVVSEKKAPSVPASPPSRLPIENASEDERGEEDVEALISPSAPLPIDRKLLESELRRVSPEMQRYIKYLLRQYEKSHTEAKMNGESCEIDQR